MYYDFDIKFTEKDIDIFIDKIYNNYQSKPNDSYHFNLTKIEWMSNQGLLIFSGILKYFIEKGIDFKVDLVTLGVATPDVPKKTALQIVQIWETWKIWKVVQHQDDLIKYFSINQSTINSLKKVHKINLKKPEIYDRYGISPFVCLNYIEDYKDVQIKELLEQYIALNKATEEILKENNLIHPFVTDIFGSIISKELYENFLDHFQNSFINGSNNWAFMNLSLRSKINEVENDSYTIQRILKSSFEKEEIPETINFFKNEIKKTYNNKPYIQFSFLDFGIGIVETIKKEYYKKYPNQRPNGLFQNQNENSILKYAFQYNTSRHPIRVYDKDSENIIDLIPRGLFDVLSIVKRYKGLLIIRSNFGKIIYDFSEYKTIDKAYKEFGDTNLFFPGTMINLYLPAIEKEIDFDYSTIKPEINIPKYSLISKKEYLNIYSLIPNIKQNKENLYSSLFTNIKKRFSKYDKTSLTLLSFLNYKNFDIRITKKIFFFLLTDYDFNLNNNFVIVNPPDEELIDEIQNEIIQLSTVVKKFKIHPLPLIYFDLKKDDVYIKWLGIFNKEDTIKLNDLLFEVFSLTKDDFSQPHDIVGHINYFDKYGNLHSHLPNREEIIELYKSDFEKVTNNLVKEILEYNNCINKKETYRLYLCNGNYYQSEYLQLINLFQNESDASLIIDLLYEKYSKVLSNTKNIKYISITSSSHKLTDYLLEKKYIKEDDLILLDNYHSFDMNEKFNGISDKNKYILICDVVSTGYLTTRLEKALKIRNAKLTKIVSIVNTIDPKFDTSKEFIEKFGNRLIYLYKYQIPKYRRKDKEIKNKLLNNEIIRINPFTNVPISLNSLKTEKERILLSNDMFLDFIDENYLKIGYYQLNHLIYSYFFDTKNIIKNIKPELIKKIFSQLELNKLTDLKILYPKDNSFKYFDFTFLKNNILKNHSIEVFILDRYKTKSGWKFPHTTDYLYEKIKNKPILLIDDGTNTGNSLIQMINEVLLYHPKNIKILSLIGRTDIYLKDFFTSLSKLNSEIDIKIYFTTYWHIPSYFADNNPNAEERKWLTKVNELINIPTNIKKIVKIILSEISPKSNCEEDYRFLPLIRSTKKIPKKELFRVRNEIGKVINYRYYKESFTYFDNFIKLYEDTSIIKNRYKEIELLCATIIYEPSIYKKIKQILPDIVDKIEEFIDAIIFRENSKKRKLDIDKDFTYLWNRKDIIHLFFIIYSGDYLYEKLNYSKTFKKLVKYIGDANYSINYILYKLLFYYPLTKEETLNKNGGIFSDLINSIIEDTSLKEYHKDLKIFKSFIMTLPSNKDYYTELLKINDNYQKLKKQDYHKNSISPYIDALLTNIYNVKDDVYDVYKKAFKSDIILNWEKISSFIEPIISFYNSYPTFFINNTSIIKNESKSLMKIHSQLNSLIYSLNINSDFSLINTLLNQLYDNYIKSSSELYQIFTKIYTTNINELIQKMLNKENILYEFNSEIDNTLKIKIPLYYFKEFIFEELINNLRHRDVNKKVIIDIKSNSNFIYINIQNNKSKTIIPGGSNGLFEIKNFNSFPNEIFQYKNPKSINTNIFNQELRFKIL